MSAQLFETFKQTTSENNEIRQQAEANLNSLRDQNVHQLITLLIGIINSNFYQIDIVAYQASLIYTWNLFPATIQSVKEGMPHPFDVYSQELVNQLLDLSFSIMVNKSPTQPNIPFAVRNFAAYLFARIASLHVHRDMNSNVIQKVTTALAESHTYEDIYPLSQVIQTVCEEYDPESEELSPLLNVIFNHFANPISPQITSELLNTLAKIVNDLSTIFNDEAIINTIITTLLNLSCVDGIQSSAFNVWSCLYKTSEDLIVAVAPQLIEISLSIIADENKSDSDVNAACKLVKQIAKLELKYDVDDFSFIRQNASNLVIALTRVCCTYNEEQCDDGSLFLPYIAASEALKNVIILLPDEILQSIFDMIKNLGASHEFPQRHGALIVLSQIVKFADNGFIGFQFLPSLFQILGGNEVPCVIFQAIRCIKNIVMRIADSETAPSPEITEKFPQICETSFQIMMQIIASADQQAPPPPAIAGFDASNLNSLPRDLYTFSPIGRQAAGLLGEISRIPGFSHTNEVLNALLHTGLKYQTSKFFEIISKIVDLGTESDVILGFFQVILNSLARSIESPATIWALHELGENVQAYLSHFGTRLEPFIPPLMQALIQGMQKPSIFSIDAFIPLAMAAKFFPVIFANSVTTDQGGREVPLPQIAIGILLSALKDLQNDEAVYNSALSLSYLFWATIVDSTNPEQAQSAQIIGGALVHFLEEILMSLLSAVQSIDLRLDSRRSCVECVADLVNYQPSLIMPTVDNFVLFLRTFAIFDVLNASYQTDPKETQLMVNALAKLTLSIMKAVGPQNAMNYKDIALQIISFVVGINETDGVISRLMTSTIELIFFIATVDQQFILEIISKEEDIGTLILTARESEIPKAQETLNLLGYTEGE